MFEAFYAMLNAILLVPLTICQTFETWLIANSTISLRSLEFSLRLFSDNPIFTMSFYDLLLLTLTVLFLVGVYVVVRGFFKIIFRWFRI